MKYEEKKQAALAQYRYDAGFSEADFISGYDACAREYKVEELAALVQRWNELAARIVEVEAENARLREQLSIESDIQAMQRSEIEALQQENLDHVEENERLREALKDAESWMRIKIGLTGKDPMDCNQYRIVLKALEQ